MNSQSAAAASIALNRFGLGARALDVPPANGQAWLLDQFPRYQPQPTPWQSQPDSATLASRAAQGQRAVAEAPEAERPALRQKRNAELRDAYVAAVNARVRSAVETPTPFVERMVHFWANHFAVSVDKPGLLALAGSFEAEAIRPHVLGNFGDMLRASVRHPAMLVYLDQPRSIGPASDVAVRAARRNPEQVRGLNENLAREVLELHTLGVRSGYGQADVTEFARALTGWTIGGLAGPRAQIEPGRFGFMPAMHEPGERVIVGRRYAQAGEAQALAVRDDLARAPATARHVAFKLVRHLVADMPPPSLVEQVSKAFLRSGGALSAVYRALIESPLAWDAAPMKFRTPWEWSIASLRALGWQGDVPPGFVGFVNQLGQQTWRPGSPAGFDDTAAAWLGPDALVRRVEVAQRLAQRADKSIDARQLAPALFPGALTASTLQAVSRADTGPVGLALLLVSPEFLRR